jgi:hypothetical protein
MMCVGEFGRERLAQALNKALQTRGSKGDTIFFIGTFQPGDRRCCAFAIIAAMIV